jgi:thiol:disulfide interchange protein DsbC
MLKVIVKVLAITLCASAASYAAQQPDSPAEAKIRTQLKARFPGVELKQITPGPIPGIFEVVTQEGVVYADASGDHLIIGKILDTQSKEDLTEARWNQVNGVEFDKLPFDQAIKFVKGNGKRQVAIFEDPHCPYCRQIETTLKDINDVTIYVFLFPIESLHPKATETARNVWCSDDRAAAWVGVMLDKKAPAAKKCDDPIDQLRKFGDSLGINGTPTMFFADGRRVTGSIPRDRFEKQLDSAQAAVAKN